MIPTCFYTNAASNYEQVPALQQMAGRILPALLHRRYTCTEKGGPQLRASFFQSDRRQSSGRQGEMRWLGYPRDILAIDVYVLNFLGRYAVVGLYFRLRFRFSDVPLDGNGVLTDAHFAHRLVSELPLLDADVFAQHVVNGAIRVAAQDIRCVIHVDNGLGLLKAQVGGMVIPRPHHIHAAVIEQQQRFLFLQHNLVAPFFIISREERTGPLGGGLSMWIRIFGCILSV